MLLYLLFIADFFIFGSAFYFMVASIREHERHASQVGATGVLFSLLLAALLVWVPLIRIPFAVMVLIGCFFGLALLIPRKPDETILKGSRGYVVGDIVRPDQRDVPFARLRSIPPGTEYYKRYYAMHPEKEEKDAQRREKGLLGKIPGAIDSGFQPNLAMVWSAFDIPDFLGSYFASEPDPSSPKVAMDPQKTTEIVKGLAQHLGACLVGICRLDPLWVYSHKGEIFFENWNEWGREIKAEDLPPYAVVIAVEMSSASVRTAPHTPCITESAINYAKGAYISTALARWFAYMGYKGIAEHTRNYDMALPAMAVDAGLGEVGRLGYLIGPKYGARLRLFAVLTDMPLMPDKPISIGADLFCKRCKKCAECCPSRSIPLGEKMVHNGSLKWKLNEDNCFEYWSKAGTDCCICMAVCPFSRPATPLHNTVRWFVARSRLAQILFPLMDNYLYGKKWRPKPAPDWLTYPQNKIARREVYSSNAGREAKK
jgi:reductive dehalogenase